MSLYVLDTHTRWRQARSAAMLTLCAGGALLAIGTLGLVLFFLVKNGLPNLSLKLLTRMPDNLNIREGGILHSLLGTLTLLGIAGLISVPLGVLGAIYQLESRTHFGGTVRFLVDVLNGVPSIVIGIFVYAAMVYPISQANPGKGYSAYAGGVALAILMIPLIMRTTEEMLKLVPQSLSEASLGLGATRWRTMFSVVLPAARGGILTGILLAVARVAGETAPLLFTILGNEFLTTHRWNGLTVLSADGPVDALPLRLYRYATNADVDQNGIAWATALLLIFMVLAMSVAARLATRGRLQTER